jgi:hypothetical protein
MKRKILAKAAVSVVALSLPSAVAAASPSASSGPLIVDANSHIVVMEYEAWFGPKAVTFQTSAAMPLLQPKDMQSVGGGYDSAGPAVMQQQVAQMEYMGVDAAIADLTNNVSCIFNGEWFITKYVPNCTPSFRTYNQDIRDNTANLFPAWTKLGTRLKLIPQLGGFDQNVLFKDQDGKTALEKEIDSFGSLLQKYPERQVIYQGKPLMLIFLGAAQDPDRSDNPLGSQISKFLKDHPQIEGRYTFKMIAGYLDSQPDLWAAKDVPTGPVKINPAFGFWSWVDRLNPTCTVTPSALTTRPITKSVTRTLPAWRTSPPRSPLPLNRDGAARTPTLRPIVPTTLCGSEKMGDTTL